MQPHDLRGLIDLQLGVVDGQSAFVFGRVSGLAMDRRGRIYVADELYQDIRVFEGDGTLVLRFGGRGDGPGDLQRPCCIALDAASRLWVTSLAAKRYDVFELVQDRPSAVARIQFAATPMRHTPVWPDGDVVGVPSSVPLSAQQVQRQLVLLNNAGDVLDRISVPAVPVEGLRLAEVTVPSRSGRGTMRVWIPQPFGPTHLIAFGKDGRYASGLTSAYDIRIVDRRGRLVRRITKPWVEGPRVTREERDSVERAMDVARRENSRAGGTFPTLQIPDRRPPVERIWFDLEGYLWIEIAADYGEDIATAEIYSTDDGVLWGTARWPRSLRLMWTSREQAMALAVRRDQLVDQVVRVRFVETRSG